jgi:DNA mismatch endonuclease (patch repair protein)
VVFCDGDFWHGRDLEHRLEKLTRDHNAAYWTAKVRRNVERDRQDTSALSAAGWNVLRFWETEVLRETTKVADRIEALLAATRSHAHRTAARSASIESGGR